MDSVALEGTAVCIGCGETKPKSDFYEDRRNNSGVWARCRPCVVDQVRQYRKLPENRERYNASSRARRLVLKIEGLARYGGVCACCGEDDVRFLTFDHVEGGGTQHRAETKRRQMARWLRDSGYPEGYQVLCWNCNSARHFNGGICPHQDPAGRITCADWQHGA